MRHIAPYINKGKTSQAQADELDRYIEGLKKKKRDNDPTQVRSQA